MSPGLTLLDISGLDDLREERSVAAGGLRAPEWMPGLALPVFYRRYTVSCEHGGRVLNKIPQLLDYFKDFQLGNMIMPLKNDANEESMFASEQLDGEQHYST